MRRRSTTLNPTTWPAARVLARYGPPAMLVAVALFQGLLVQRYDLSPWKGGGFGMFSTVDDPKARFLRLYLETDRGELPVPVPAELAHAVRELRTLPTPKRLRRLAGGLVGANWAVQEQPWIDLERLDRDSEATRDEASDCARRAGRGALAPLPLAAGDEVPVCFTLVEVRAVRLELWRYRFDQRATRIEVERLLEVRAEGGRLGRRGLDA